jgi:hypothetical protein
LRRDVPAGASQFSASGIFKSLPAGDPTILEPHLEKLAPFVKAFGYE